MFTTSTKKFTETRKYPELNIKAVFFDMDGVLYDSMKYHAKAWVRAMKEMNLPFTEHDCYMNEGSTGSSTINKVMIKEWGREASEEEKENIYKLKSEYFNEEGRVNTMPFALDLLKKIKSESLQIFVVTGSGQPGLINGLERDFPGIFEEGKMVTAFDVKKGKPDPEPYLMALEKSGVEAWEALVVENAPLGVQAASEAGLFCIGVNTGPLDSKVLSDAGANIVLNSMEELYHNWEKIIR